MKLETLEEFLDLSKDLNFSASAERLNLSVSALSTHIGTLEKELGCTLLKRGPNRSLTSDGRLFLSYAYKILDLVAESKKQIELAHEAADRTIKVDSNIGYFDAANTFLQAISDFTENNPGAHFQMTRGTSDSFVESLLSKEIDCGLIATIGHSVPSWLDTYDISSVCISSEEASVWIPKKNALAYADVVKLRDLESHRFLLRNNQRIDIWKHSIESIMGEVGLRPHYNITCTESETEFGLVDFDDSDISLGPTSLFENTRALHLRINGVLKKFDPPLVSNAYVCYRSNDNNPIMQLFISTLRGHIENE